MKEIAISVDNVEKSFKIYKDKGFTLKERVLFFKSRNAYVKNNILKGISFDIEKGDFRYNWKKWFWKKYSIEINHKNYIS